MPKRKEVIVRIEMTPTQSMLMRKLISNNLSLLTTETKTLNKGMSQMLTYLRQAANHP